MIKNGMTKIQITPYHLKESLDLYEFKVLKGSVTKGEGNRAGAIGEVVIRDMYNAVQAYDFHYDLLIGGEKIEIKTKIYTPGLIPNSNWNASVLQSSMFQRCDKYVFCLIPKNYSVLYICGWITKERFMKEAKYFKRGSYSTNYDGTRWKVPHDIWMMPINKLD